MINSNEIKSQLNIKDLEVFYNPSTFRIKTDEYSNNSNYNCKRVIMAGICVISFNGDPVNPIVLNDVSNEKVEVILSTIGETKKTITRETILPTLANNKKQVIKNKLIEFSKLDTNWDGYGGDTPSREAIGNAVLLLNILDESLIRKLQVENVIPTSYGTIVFDWTNNNELISLEIGDSDLGFFSEFNDNSNPNIEKTIFNNELPTILSEAFRKLYKKENRQGNTA